MRLLNYCFLIGGILIASCVGNSSNKSQNDKKINPADTIYLGDLREKFEGDSVFFCKSGTGSDIDRLSIFLGGNRGRCHSQWVNKRLL